VRRLQRHAIQSLGAEQGFTLIELLIVIIILGILLTIAVPSYVSFKDRAAKAAASANLRNASEAISAFYQDNGTYATMNTTLLQAYNRNMPTIVYRSRSATTYCVSSQSGNWLAYKAGPGAKITMTACT
jgi:prepilin-type N-terminal cleavage/methylation domain-containing protein